MTLIAFVVRSLTFVTGGNGGLDYWNSIGKGAGKSKDLFQSFVHDRRYLIFISRRATFLF